MTAAEYIAAVRELPCSVSSCRQYGVHAHHARGGSISDRGVVAGAAQRNSDFLAIPLCPAHHVGKVGIHKLGVRTWEEFFGPQTQHVDMTGEILRVDPWKEAKKSVRKKPWKRPSKINARRVG